MPKARETRAVALARLYDLDLVEDPGDASLYLGLAARSGGPVVELGVGTGRLAVPLAAAGYDVIGVDADAAMLARAHRRAAEAGRDVAGRLRLVREDMVAVERADLGDGLEGGARLVFVGLNTILLLASLDRQRELLATMAGLLAPGGLAVVDAWQPGIDDLAAFDSRISLDWLRTDPETHREVAKLSAAWYDPASRTVTVTTFFDEAEPGGPVTRWTRSDELRLVTAAELQAAADAAGLEVSELAGDHDLGPFGPDSERLVVVAMKPR